MNIIIVHGARGNPNESWFPWLKEELEALGHNVFIPQFPSPENIQSWLETFEAYKQHLNKDTILIGHSLGVPFILNILEKNKARAAFLVSGFIGLLDDRFNPIIKTFSDKDFDFDTILANCDHFYIYHSDNDPYVPLEKAQELAEKLKVEVRLIPGAGHFNIQSGYTMFIELLQDIKNNIDLYTTST